MSVGQTYVRGQIPDKENREKDDFYPTPAAGTLALLGEESFDGSIWEPACGDGAISKVLVDAGYTVTSTDLVDRGYGDSRVDFLMETQGLAPNIISNPPFKMAEEFARHALSLTTGKVAMLCRLAWLEGQKRQQMFESTPLARVHVFSRRLTMLRGGEDWEFKGGGMVAFAWYVWDHAHEGPATLNWVNPVTANDGEAT